MAVAKKTTKTATKTTAKKAATSAAKKTTAKAVEQKVAETRTTVSVQFSGKEYTTEELIKIAKDVWQYDLQKDPADIKEVELYVKPEESAAYYVINGDVTGSFAL